MNTRANRIARFLAYACGILAGLVLVLIVAAGITVYWAYKNPLPAFQFVQSRFLPADLEVNWAKVDFNGNRIGGLDFLIDIAFEDLLITKESPSVDVPIQRARVRASVFPLRRSAHVELLEVNAPSQITFRAEVPLERTPEKNPFEQIQSVLRILEIIRERVPIEQVDAKIAKFVFQPASGEPLAMLIGLTKPAHEPLEVVYAMNLPGDTSAEISAGAQLDFTLMKTSAPFLSGSLKFKSAGVETKQNLVLVSDETQTLLTSEGTVSYRNKKLALFFEPKLTARFTSSEAKVTLDGGVKGIPGPLVEVEKIHAELKTALESGAAWSTKPSKFAINAPVKLFFVSKKNRAILEKACDCKLPEILNVKAEGSLWLASLLGHANHSEPVVALDTELAVETVDNKIVAVDLKGGLKLEIQRGTEQDKYLFSPRIDCLATVRSFKGLKTFLDANGVLIPAPLDVMDGSIRFVAKGPVATDDNGSRFPLLLGIDLASSGQKVKVDTDRTVQLNSQLNQAHLDVNAKVSNLVIDLPPLRPLDGLPRIASDSRFIKEPPKKPRSAGFKFSFNFQIETLSADAIRLKSPYFDPYLPVNLKIQAGAGGENTGFISIQPFNITYLRRTVHVENLTLNLDGDEKAPLPIKGRFSVKQTDYTIFIDVEGNTKNPKILFSSEPYLPKDEIISVLLYDRTSDQLQAGDAETKGGVQAAIADRAIGLFGLWAFASTPIKSFSYNPVTKVYSASIAVSDDVTAGIGTSWESAAHLELRKRVSKRWSLTAAWTPATQEERGVTKLVLQWERRF